MLIIDKVTKSFSDKPIIDYLSLEVTDKEIFTLLGESGCGKTTLLRLIAGFETPDLGKIYIEGKDMTDTPVEKRPVGFIFQNYALFGHLSVYDNIAVGPRVRKVTETKIELFIDGLLDTLRLKGLKNARPQDLSGGEKQRVAIARAIINRPKILLLDEPFSALDPGLRSSLREEMADSQKAFGITFLFVTHDQDEALSLSHRIGILHNGKLLQVGSPSELYKTPGSRYVAEFFGEANRLEGMVEQQNGNRVWVNVDHIGTLVCDTQREWEVNTPVELYIRPESIFLSLKEVSGGSSNEFAGILFKKTFLGSATRYEITLKNGETCSVLSGSSETNDNFSKSLPGSKVSVLLESRHILLMPSNPLTKRKSLAT
jgi:ABC-type Fe3+/spermidine/putrescine transport system ATPase subunit